MQSPQGDTKVTCMVDSECAEFERGWRGVGKTPIPWSRPASEPAMMRSICCFAGQTRRFIDIVSPMKFVRRNSPSPYQQGLRDSILWRIRFIFSVNSNPNSPTRYNFIERPASLVILIDSWHRVWSNIHVDIWDLHVALVSLPRSSSSYHVVGGTWREEHSRTIIISKIRLQIVWYHHNANIKSPRNQL